MEHHWERQGRSYQLFCLPGSSGFCPLERWLASGHSVAHCIAGILKPSEAAAKRKQKLSLLSGRQIEQREDKSEHLGHSASPGIVGDNSSSVLSWGLLPAGTQAQQGLPPGNPCLVLFSPAVCFLGVGAARGLEQGKAKKRFFLYLLSGIPKA